MVKGIFFNFYCIFAVLGVAAFILLGVDFGPMKRAQKAYLEKCGMKEKERRDKADETEDVKETVEETEKETVEETGGEQAGKAGYLLIPLALMIIVAVAYIFYSGGGNMMNGDAETGLIFGICAGCLYLAAALAVSKKISLKQNIDNLFTGCGNMFGIVIIMVLAYALSDLLGALGTAEYLSGVLIKLINPAVFVLVAFLLTSPSVIFYGNKCGNHRHYDADPLTHGAFFPYTHSHGRGSRCGRGGVWGPYLAHIRYHHHVLFIYRL